jgi:aryl-alcohol dehydrogenase-like predicted oxidoreductase
MKRNITRRRFVKNASLAAAAITTGPGLRTLLPGTDYDPKGIPTRMLGKTGVGIPVYVVGLGSRWMAVEDNEKAVEILEYALDQGLYHWDTAASYGNDTISSEERIGMILPEKRKQVFLSSKVGEERTADNVRKTLETSLKRLGTDYIDLYQVHSVLSEEDAGSFGKKGGVVEGLQKAREEGLVRFIGFTGHTDAAGMKKAAVENDFDTMLIALDHQENGEQPFERLAIPAAAEKGMGVLAMKVIRPREAVEGITPDSLINYALSLKKVSAAVIGTDSIDVVKANVELVRNFTPMSEDEMQQLRMALRPFHRGHKVPWLQEGYVDGYIA